MDSTAEQKGQIGIESASVPPQFGELIGRGETLSGTRSIWVSEWATRPELERQFDHRLSRSVSSASQPVEVAVDITNISVLIDSRIYGCVATRPMSKSDSPTWVAIGHPRSDLSSSSHQWGGQRLALWSATQTHSVGTCPPTHGPWVSPAQWGSIWPTQMVVQMTNPVSSYWWIYQWD